MRGESWREGVKEERIFFVLKIIKNIFAPDKYHLFLCLK